MHTSERTDKVSDNAGFSPRTVYRCYIQRLTLTMDDSDSGKRKSSGAELRERIIKRAAVEFRDGMYGILADKLSSLGRLGE